MFSSSSSRSNFDGNVSELLRVLSNSLSGNENNNNGGNENSENQHHHINGQLRKLHTDLSYINDSLKELKILEDSIEHPLKVVCKGLDNILPDLYRGSLPTTNDAQIDLRKINKVVSNLKFLVPSPYKISSDSYDLIQFTRMETLEISMGENARNLFDELPNLHMNEHFLGSSTFNDIKQVYRGLDINLKLCLLCFSVFPEGAVVKRRILLYWWIGEGFIVLPVAGGSGENPVEEVADEILREFVKKGFIEPVNKKCKLVPKRFKMHPLVRAVVIQLAKEADFFDFGAKGNPTANFLSSHRACVTHEDSSVELTTNRSKRHQEQLYTWFNLGDQVLVLKPDWFLKLKNIRVLQMGRWQASSMHRIEMEDTEFLKRLKNMKHLMFFSLQGIHGITELPATIGSLTSLRILDLRACHNLEQLSEEIALLKNLTHLDMSDCYLINMMPKGIASLLELQVLKGFIIGNPKRSPCTLDDLKRLKNLRKLTIRTTWEGFPTNKQVKALQQLNGLRKLKISWGVSYLEKSAAANTSKPSKTLSKFAIMKKGKTSEILSLLPTNLEKLDLHCFPHKKRPDWLMPSQLMSLKKLYIRGGNLSYLSHVNDQWTVEILRFKHLCDLKIDWAELQASFPELKYLEKVQCPKLTFYPCNERGVWLKR